MNNVTDIVKAAEPAIEEFSIERLHGAPIIAEIEQQIARTERLERALEKIRTACVKATVPSDWQKFGDQLYLEGDGALRIAPLIGLQMSNVRKTREITDDGAVRVTCEGDFQSLLFGTRLVGISKSRRDDDDFLTKGKGSDYRADIYEVEASAYKGMIGRAVQLLAGLSGLKAEEMKARFGFEWDGSAVQFRGGKTEAKRAESQAVAEPLKEIHRILRKVSNGDDKTAADILERLTKNDEKGWPGKRDPNKLTEAGVKFALSKLQKMEAEFDATMAKEGGE